MMNCSRRQRNVERRIGCRLVFAVVLAAVFLSAFGLACDGSEQTAPDPKTGLLLNGRRLAPQGAQVTLGNFPTGGAVTVDGRFLWTVSTGSGYNDIRIVDTTSKKVIQNIPVTSVSGGIALDSAHRLAYISGLTLSRWQPSRQNLPGAKEGNCVFVYSWAADTGQATFVRVIALPPQSGAPNVQVFPAANYPDSWPQKLAVSPDGSQLLVPLNLADSAAVIDVNRGDQIRYASMGSGSYPYAAAILPDGRTGLVSNEATGMVSVVDMATATKLSDIAVGPPLSHPLGIAIDSAGKRAYVAVSALDQVVVVDLATSSVERTLSVESTAGLGTMPVAVALSPDGSRLFVAESGVAAIGVIRLPGSLTAPALEWSLVGNIPVGDDPQVVLTAASEGSDASQLLYITARGLGVGPNPNGPVPTKASDPIFWAFNPVAPTEDPFRADTGIGYMPGMVLGRAGLMTLPSDAQVVKLTPAALSQIQPVDAQEAPVGTPLRADGPIKHVFFIVRENRSYDQLLGDVSRGDGSAQLTIFGQNVTPNLHSLVARFPLLDHVFANSEASVQGHYWTAAAIVPDYVDRNWVHVYAGRGRPNDSGIFAVTFPGNGFLFNQAERQGISYFNYGEGFGASGPTVPDRNRTAEVLAAEQAVAAHSDLGPPLTADGTFPSDLSIGTSLDGKEVFDCSLPAGAPAGSYSRVDSFRARFEAQLAADSVPTLNYICLTSDHTRGTQPGFPIPVAMVADSDLAIGQIVDMISHSDIWSSSAIFIVEDDSQDGADHVDAHRIPVAVISPYAREGAVIHTRYDLLSVVRSIELIIDMDPLSLNDALATPMYDAFTSEPLNSAPVDVVPANINLLTMNTQAAPWAALSAGLELAQVDAVPQRVLDSILWKSVYGLDSTPPPPGPNAEYEE